ncbi:hypothetical protein AgCh_010419 [Apium graveolens]
MTRLRRTARKSVPGGPYRVEGFQLPEQKGGFSKSLANSATDWPCLLLELLSTASELDYFQTFGWTPQEGKLHMVNDYFSPAEWNVIVEVLGPNPRHLFELYALKQSNYYQKIMEDRSSSFEDIVDAYLAYLQINYLADCSLEILDDPSALALVEVGLLYAQRDPSIIRPLSHGIQRCLVRWLVQERLQMSFGGSLRYMWQRAMRGRSYRHLMLQIGSKYSSR